MGRPVATQPLPPAAFVREAFDIRDSVIVRLKDGKPAASKGSKGGQWVRMTFEGRIRRIAALRVAWALACGVPLCDEHRGRD